MSGEVRRYTVNWAWQEIEPDHEGGYVLHSDYADLLARYEAVAGDAENWRALSADCDAQPCQWPCLRDDLGDWSLARRRAMQDNGSPT